MLDLVSVLEFYLKCKYLSTMLSQYSHLALSVFFVSFVLLCCTRLFVYLYNHGGSLTGPKLSNLQVKNHI